MASRVESHQLHLDKARARAAIRKLTGKRATEAQVLTFLQTEKRIEIIKRICTTGDEARRASAIQDIDKSPLDFLKRELMDHIGKKEYRRLATMPLELGVELRGE